MATKDFDYESFAQNLALQAQEMVPAEFTEDQKQYVVKTLGNFSLISGKALAEDPELNFDAEQSIMITQIIAEWSFHKSVDLIRSGIPQQYWDTIMQKIAFTIFEIAKQTFSQGLPQEKILELIEHHVKRSYTEALTELKDHGIIDEGLMEFAASQSNMDRLAQEMQQAPPAEMPAGSPDELAPMPMGEIETDNSFPKVDSKVLKLATVAMLFNRIQQDKVQTILNKFNQDDAEAVIKFMRMSDLPQRIGPANALRCLQEIKTNLPRSTDLAPNKVVLKLRKIATKYSRKEIDTMLITERIGVKRLVFNALEGNYYEQIPPKVASIVATHLCNGV